MITKMKKNSIFLLVVIIFSCGYSQKKYPQNYFGLPVDIPMILSGNFGELRPNHFHAGIDIKTPNGQGEKIYAIADGFVSRIKISTRGYGKVLYITHPNGYTSVYAHLQKFSSNIQSYVKQRQYQEEKFEIELFLQPSEIPVKKGEIIAFSGNTGGSAAPHLHFEIRDTQTQKSVNPKLFGYQVQDLVSPEVRVLYAYSLDEQSVIKESQLPQKLTFFKQSEGVYIADKIQAFGKIGIGVQTIDRKDFTYNIYGVYKSEIHVNGVPKLSYTFDEMSFAEDHLINTLIDYKVYSHDASRVQLMYKKKANKLSFYSAEKEQGMIDVQDGYTYMVTLLLTDFNKNTTKVLIPIEGKKQEVRELTPTRIGKYLKASRDNFYKTSQSSVFMPANTFYEDIYIDVNQQGDTIKVFPNDVPLQKNYTLTINTDSILNNNELEKTFIAWIHPKNKKILFNKTIRKGTNFSIRTKRMGDFVLAKDSLPPTILPLNFSLSYNNVSKLSQLKVKIQDEFSGISQYKATINGKWILMEYEPKEDLLFFDLSDIFPITESELLFRLQVWDNVGNVQEIEIPLVIN